MAEKPDRSECQDPVVIPIEDHLDLHSFAPKHVKAVVEEYLFQCLEKGLLEIRIIHGRGTGKQRGSVRALLARHPHVLGFSDASSEAGGWGATVVRLKPKDVGFQ
jgi:DNA-nicking Smr family endonuclease